jgi:septal ring factor EnvC (AmiA/AmiB activator)
MTEILEQRVRDVEELIYDIPQRLEARLNNVAVASQETGSRLASLERQVSAASQEASSRINLLERQMAQMLREARDMRGGVTAQLLAQDRRIDNAEHKLDTLITEVREALARVPKP